MERFREAITYIFKEKGWENKILVIYAFLVIASIIGGFVSLTVTLPLDILTNVMKEQGREVEGLKSLSSAFSSMTSFFTLPILLYIYGYLIDVVRNLSSKSKVVLVENTDIATKIVKGVKLYITLIIATLPTTLVGGLLFILSVLGTIAMFSLTTSSPMFLVAGIALTILTIFLCILLVILNSIISYASMYIYFKSGSFRQSFSYKNIYQTIRSNEKPLLNLFVDILVLGLIEMAFVLIFFIPLLCVAPFVFPMVTLVSLFAKAYLIANRFNMMKSSKNS